MTRKDIECRAERAPRVFSTDYYSVWDHFREHRDQPIQKHPETLECGGNSFNNCSYINEHSCVFWLFLLNGFFSRIDAPYHKRIIDELRIGIKYSDLQEHGIIAPDGCLSSLGRTIYFAIERFALTKDEVLHLIRNSHAIELLSDSQLKHYLQDQFDLF